MQIVRYTPDKAQEWDNFIEGSRNGTFLFLRGYMDYHSDRFKDHSLMYYSDKGKLLAVMAANENNGVLWSHQGLTYGGFVLAPKVHAAEVGEMFDLTLPYLKSNHFTEWYYKQIPTIYHKLPSQEDEYWLWRHGAEEIACNMMTAVEMKSDTNIVAPRKHSYCNKLLRQGYTVEMNVPISDFWSILETNLEERFGAKPVHAQKEIELLKGRFPENIICCTVKSPTGETVAGSLLFITDSVVRTQYISASHKGKQTNAIDFLMLTLIKHYGSFPKYKYFEFGTSMAEDGIHLNEGLILQKECFGGRGVSCKTYKIKV